MGYIAGIGGANADIHGHGTAATFNLRDSNQGKVHITPGGVTRNMLETLARLGATVELCSVIGDDAFGKLLQDDCAEKGIGQQCLKVIPGSDTATYLDVLDADGDMIVALCDGTIRDEHMDGVFIKDCLPLLNGADLVLLDANIAPKALEVLIENCTAPLYMDPVSIGLAERIRPFLPSFDTIKPNMQELEALLGTPVKNLDAVKVGAKKLLDEGVKNVWVSMGVDGLYYIGEKGELAGRRKKMTECVNATGAGDATMAAIAWCQSQNMPLSETMNVALAAGIIAIGSDFSVSPETSPAKIEEVIEEYLV